MRGVMKSSRGCRANEHNMSRRLHNGGVGLDSDTLLVLRLSDARALRVLSYSVFLAMVILTLPFMHFTLRGLDSGGCFDASLDDFGSDLVDVDCLDLLLQDLANEGLLLKGDKALIVSSGTDMEPLLIDSSWLMSGNEIDQVSRSDLAQEFLFPNATFDFALTLRFEDVILVDRILKVGGIVVTQSSNDEVSNAYYQKQSNYRIVYIRKYYSTIVAMRKTSLISDLVAPAKRRPLQANTEALEGLEDVPLEPSFNALTNPEKYWNKFKYLPDKLGNPLEGYPHRSFILFDSLEEKDSVMAWFDDNYPTRNQEFELHFIEIPFSEISTELFDAVSNWLIKNVNEDDLVVMKADAEVVEEMINRNIIGLVDELFLECQNRWQSGERNRSKRAYWECLALHGRLRDVGVAVRQWWT